MYFVPCWWNWCLPMCYTESSNIHVLLPHKNLHKQKCKFPRIKFGKPEQTKMLCKYPNKSKEKEINWTPCTADRHICMKWCGWPSKEDREVEEREKMRVPERGPNAERSRDAASTGLDVQCKLGSSGHPHFSCWLPMMRERRNRAGVWALRWREEHGMRRDSVTLVQRHRTPLWQRPRHHHMVWFGSTGACPN